jgi:site-specific DNA-cytosine methylase
MDRAFLDAGFDVTPGCEIDHEMRAMHDAFCGGGYLAHDLRDLVPTIRGRKLHGIIGGPPCQSHTKLKAIRAPKFPDLTPLVNSLLDATEWDWFLFENVVPIAIPGAKHVRLNAMHFHSPHQSRERWFTFSSHITPPAPVYHGDVDELMAYPVVAGRIYGPKRGAKLQGYPEAARLPFRCVTLQKGLANAVPYPIALAWARQIAATQEAPHA